MALTVSLKVEIVEWWHLVKVVALIKVGCFSQIVVIMAFARMHISNLVMCNLQKEDEDFAVLLHIAQGYEHWNIFLVSDELKFLKVDFEGSFNKHLKIFIKWNINRSRRFLQKQFTNFSIPGSIFTYFTKFNQSTFTDMFGALLWFKNFLLQTIFDMCNFFAYYTKSNSQIVCFYL